MDMGSSSLQVLLLDNNLLHQLPPFLSAVRKLEEVKFSGNNLHFPPEDILSQDWASIKQYLRQYMTKSNLVKKSPSGNKLNLALTSISINTTKDSRTDLTSSDPIFSSSDDDYFDEVR